MREALLSGRPSLADGGPIVRLCGNDEQPAMLRIVNTAARKYRGVIPDDRWRDPYMPADELSHEIAGGVVFWGAELNGVLVGVMGKQAVLDVDLIRHAYVMPDVQGHGVGGVLLRHLCARTSRPILVGTWAAATWAIAFYERHGFDLIPRGETAILLRKYWSIPERQIETSVVLRRP
jgi:GNAT superfamily N-acetyltransferase